jgi:lipoprotein Spr
MACRPSARYKASNEYPERYTIDESSQQLEAYIHQWLHTPYKYGGMSKNGIDCSGFSSRVLKDVYHLQIPRTAESQYENGQKVSDSRRRTGDLVFFRNVRGRGIDHVGVFLGNNQFVHASTNAGVIISDLDEEYYHKRYVGACRYGIE